MEALSEHELLPLWEQGENAAPVARAALLLGVAAPDAALDELTVGERDAALLALHVRTFGDRLDGFVRCPDCDEPLEVAFGPRQIEAVLAARPEPGEHVLAVGDYELRFRPITCADLAHAVRAGGADEARAALVERSVVDARLGEGSVAPAALPEEVVAALAERLAACDPQAEIALAVECPDCGCAWRPILDVASFLWSEVGRSARRLLDDVHVLATAYGWTEPDVLALGSRRRTYVELALS